MSHTIPRGFRLAAARCGLKSDPSQFDITVVAGDRDLVAAGVYTQNLIYAAPVALDRQRTPASNIRIVVANSGNANACTGERGMQDAMEMAAIGAAALGAEPEQALVLSTGVIGEYLPLEKIRSGIQHAAAELAADDDAIERAAQGIMTTDRYAKIASRALVCDGQACSITGIAKGAGMIGPKMATMLAIVMTDAALDPDNAQAMLQHAVDRSFNCISVEGHMSTNDTVLLLASGAARPEPLDASARRPFAEALEAVCIELARMIPNDGEGASHLVTINVRGTRTDDDAQQIARTIANSPLVKTAVAGNDPNWGRIVSAAGYAGVPFDPAGVTLQLNGITLYEHGAPVAFDAGQAQQSMRDRREVDISLQLAEGSAHATFWTSDLTVDYVKLNAEYHT